MQISSPSNLKRMSCDKTSQNNYNINEEKKEIPTKASKKAKRCCF
jgi:hypothetical protein